MKALHLLLLLILPIVAFAQSIEKADEKIIIAKGDKGSFQMIADSLSSILPEKSVYLIGETHRNKANDFIFFPMFKELHMQKSVNYILMEMNHSLFFGYNLFLKYGDVQILADFMNLKDRDTGKLANRFRDEIALYNYNSTLPEPRKIQYIGTDLDISNVPPLRSTTQHHYITAMRYFKKYKVGTFPSEVGLLLDEIIDADVSNAKNLIKLNAKLKSLSIRYKNELKYCFGEFYKDFYIIVNSSKIFPMGSRDADMLDNLETAYSIIKEMDPNSVPKFFGSFGANHVKPGKNGSFASRINRSDVIKGGVGFIGTAYFSTKSNYAKNAGTIDRSSLGGLTKEEELDANSFLRDISVQQKAPIILLGRFDALSNGKLNFLKGFDAIFVFTGF